MEPVVYDFAVNPVGTCAELLPGNRAMMPRGYYALLVPRWLREDPRQVSGERRRELDQLGLAARQGGEQSGLVEVLFDRMLPKPRSGAADRREELQRLLAANGFDRDQHERIRQELRRGLIGLAQNRLPVSSGIDDVRPDDVFDSRDGVAASDVARGEDALRNGEVAVVTLAAGAGSRWTQGAGVVKALHPFARIAGRHRNFLDVHLARTRRTAQQMGVAPPHVITVGYMTHQPIANYLQANPPRGIGPVRISPGSSVGLRLVPMERDLRFLWEETAHQVLDEQKQKVRESVHAALINWAKSVGEGADYTENEPLQCLHPVGHWAEVPNMLRNGVLAQLLSERPNLKYLLVHNIDTLGASLDPGLLGWHIRQEKPLSYEVIGRRLEDRGGGLARVDGRVRLLEGLALPREEEEFHLSYYNTLSNWITIDGLLALFGLSRSDLADAALVASAVHRFSAKLPTYVTLKDVKRRWGQGQEDIFPVCQFEKLWGDMTAVAGVEAGFVVVPRRRGQQLKDIAQLDAWFRDGSAEYVESLGEWD
jgi:hypothetical protein